MSADVRRPALHFTARSGWINDPLALTWRDGRYHLFFQHVPGRTVWGPEQRWGHATSADALHWTEEPVALAPGDGDGGVWSGSVVQPPGGAARLFYTSVDVADPQVGRVRVALAQDESWRAWRKGPVVAELPPGVEAVAFRDPYVFRDGDAWRMLLGAGLADGTAVALTYRSADLASWRFDGELASRHRGEADPVWTGSVWECPQLFPLGDRWVLAVSVWEPEVPHYEAYAVGDYRDGRFEAASWHRLTYGPSLYAGSAFADRDGSRGLVHWLRGVEDPGNGWASAHSLPHVLRLAGDEVVATPHPALDALREGPAVLEVGAAVAVPVRYDVEWWAPAGAECRIARGRAREATARLTRGGDAIAVTVGERTWRLPSPDGAVRVVVDGPVLEVFTSAGVLAAPLPPAESAVLTVSAGGGRVFALR